MSVTDKQTDRQTDHATEKCVAIGGIACIRAIPPENVCRKIHWYRNKIINCLPQIGDLFSIRNTFT